MVLLKFANFTKISRTIFIYSIQVRGLRISRILLHVKNLRYDLHIGKCDRGYRILIMGVGQFWLKRSPIASVDLLFIGCFQWFITKLLPAKGRFIH